jgi:hypothetical protein
MRIFNRRSKQKTSTLCILLLVLLITVANMDIVQADIAPPEPPSGTDPLPGSETTNVRMISEMVVIEIDADNPLDKGFGNVTATFTMRNLGDIDEQMDVRFPLDQTFRSGNLCNTNFPQSFPISDLRATINGKTVATQKTYQDIIIPFEEEPGPTITMPCWEYFPVFFPVGKDVIIQVTYTAEPYNYGGYNYSYVLETGNGWKDTIGTVDIIFQVPYELNDQNFIHCIPEECKVSSTKILWHYENLDPTSNVSVSLLPPPLWQRILIERENTARNPNDGEAWGRLGKAYKESIMQNRGFRSDAVGEELYQLSNEAYLQAVTLLPNDADWQYGYAVLLCWNAEWNNFLVDSESQAWHACVEQIQQVIKINPKHEKMQEWIQHYQLYNMIDFNGSQPDYIILSPIPSITPTSTKVPTQKVVPATIIPSATIPVTKTAPSIATVAILPTAIPVQSPGESNIPIFIGGVILLFIAVFIILKFKKT